MSIPGPYIREARTAWKYLSGIVCVFKPVGINSFRLGDEVRSKIVIGLNAMKVREPETLIEVKRIEGTENQRFISGAGTNTSCKSLRNNPSEGADLEKLFETEVLKEIEDGPDTIQIVKRANYADHPLVVGPRYQEGDLKIWDVSRLGTRTSGISVLGINRGIRTAQNLEHLRWLRTYVISGQFGIATNTGFHTGKIIDKCTYHKLKWTLLDRYLAATQASHQKNMFHASGVHLRTERAYELASQGLPRPDNKSTPLIYSMKCTKFELPNFDIEVTLVNENEDFLVGLIHDTGIRLHSAAVCTKIRCIKYGLFGLDLAILPKHYGPESFINNILKTKAILDTVDLRARDQVVTNQSSDRLKYESSHTDEMQGKSEHI